MPSSSQSDGSEAGRIVGQVAALDGVRGVAIAIVLIHNASFVLHDNTAFLPKLASAIAATGWVGVQLFFVLSGFLITGILLEARGSRGFFRTFYIRRTLRIFPLYYVFLAVAILVLPAILNPSSWTTVATENQWWYWTYTANWGSPLGHGIPYLSHFWSLAVEEQFYLVWPLLVFLLPPGGLIAVCTVAIVATPLVRLALHAAGLPAPALYEFTIARWDALAAGAVMAILLRDARGRRLLARHMKYAGIAALLSLVLFVLIRRGFHGHDLAVQVLGQSLIAVLAATLIYICVEPSSRIERALRNAFAAHWLRFLGKYSYAIYVFHFPIHQFASTRLANAVNGPDTNWRLLRLAIYVSGIGALSILAAMLSWRVIEKPCLDLKNRLAPRPPIRRQ